MAKSASVKSVKKSMKDPELGQMFNQMVGATDPDPNVVLPKFEKVAGIARNTIRLLSSFIDVRNPFYSVFGESNNKGIVEIREFVKSSFDTLDSLNLEKNDDVISGADLNELNQNPDKIKEFVNNSNNIYKIKNLKNKWTALKGCSVVQNMIFIAKNIKQLLEDEKKRSKSQTHNLEAKESLSGDFILNSDGDFLKIFPFSSLDFKYIFLSEMMTPDISRYVLLFLHILYKDAIKVAETITSPDIDIDKFSALIIGQISNFQKMVPRCGKAFKKIEDSVGLLKGNFNTYYKDFIISQDNPSIMIENFVLDVSKTCGPDPELVRQFRDIMGFINKNMSSNKINDPKLQKMYSMMSENLGLLENISKEKK
jgi:hypothetical protein